MALCSRLLTRPPGRCVPPPGTAPSSSTTSSGCYASARAGTTCPPGTATGKASTNVSQAGLGLEILERIFQVLLADPNNACVMIDCANVRAHKAGRLWEIGPSKYEERSRGGLTTRIKLATDARAYPLRLTPTEGQDADAHQAVPLSSGIKTGLILADKVYEGDKLLNLIQQQGAIADMPPNPTGITHRNTTGSYAKIDSRSS